MSKKKKILLIILIILCALALLSAGMFIGYRIFSEKESEKVYNEVASSYVGDLTEAAEPELQGETTAATNEASAAPTTKSKEKQQNTRSGDNPVDFNSLMEMNPDVYSWIYIPNTSVNYPVCQSRLDDNYYLDHDVYGNYSFPGAIYSQLSNRTDYSDPVTVLYGHNMANKTMFGSLHYFEDPSFFNSNKFIYIYTKDRVLTYEIISAFQYDDRHIMNSFNFADSNELNNFINDITNPRSTLVNVNNNINITANSKILVLSTCLNSGYGRYLVTGALVRDERTE